MFFSSPPPLPPPEIRFFVFLFLFRFISSFGSVFLVYSVFSSKNKSLTFPLLFAPFIPPFTCACVCMNLPSPPSESLPGHLSVTSAVQLVPAPALLLDRFFRFLPDRGAQVNGARSGSSPADWLDGKASGSLMDADTAQVQTAAALTTTATATNVVYF